MKDIWYKKYRPSKIEDYVFHDDSLKQKVNEWIETKNFPSLLLLGQAGSGKSTLAHILATQCDFDETDIQFISASVTNGVDDIRDKVIRFAERSAFGENGRLVILDECLEENEKVRIGTVDEWQPVALKDLVWGETYPVVSFNMETGSFENDTGTLISEKEDELYEVELEDGRAIVLNAKHPFIVKDDNGAFVERTIEGGLCEGDTIIVEDADLSHTVDVSIKTITEIGSGKVRNLTVHKNHTFLTENGIVTHNCDYLTPNAQAALRNIIGEVSNVRFILIGNYPHKIIDALKSRCLPIIFNEMNREQFIARMVYILTNEKVKFDIDTVLAHYNAHYPDLRKAINSMEAMVSNSTLGMPISDTTEVSDWMNYAIVYFESGKIEDARKLIIENITYEDYDFFYEYLYKNVDVFANGDTDKRDACIIAIADSMVSDTQVANREINLSACLAKLTRISKK